MICNSSRWASMVGYDTQIWDHLTLNCYRIQSSTHLWYTHFPKYFVFSCLCWSLLAGILDWYIISFRFMENFVPTVRFSLSSDDSFVFCSRCQSCNLLHTSSVARTVYLVHTIRIRTNYSRCPYVYSSNTRCFFVHANLYYYVMKTYSTILNI